MNRLLQIYDLMLVFMTKFSIISDIRQICQNGLVISATNVTNA